MKEFLVDLMIKQLLTGVHEHYAHTLDVNYFTTDIFVCLFIFYFIICIFDHHPLSLCICSPWELSIVIDHLYLCAVYDIYGYTFEQVLSGSIPYLPFSLHTYVRLCNIEILQFEYATFLTLVKCLFFHIDQFYFVSAVRFFYDDITITCPKFQNISTKID